MFTQNTLLAIKILAAIKYGNSEKNNLQSPDVLEVLHRLEKSGIISCKKDGDPSKPESYQLNCNYSSITMSQLLIAINEGIKIVPYQDEEEKIYDKYGIDNRHLGILNYMMRKMLSEVHISCNL